MDQLTIPCDFTLPNVAQIKSALQGVLAEGSAHGRIELTIMQVGNIDGAGLQLLLSFWHAASEAGCDVVLRGVMPAVRRVLEDYDVADRFTLADADLGAVTEAGP